MYPDRKTSSPPAWVALAISLGIFASGCVDRPEKHDSPAKERAIATPQHTTACGAPEPDSTAAVVRAIAAVSNPEPLPLRVGSFVRHHEGVLVSLLPTEMNVVGGGGLVWVDRDGCITLLKRYE